MKKLLVIIVIVLIVLGAWQLLKNNNTLPQQSNAAKTTSSTANHTTQPTETTQAVATDKVTIQNVAFSPANITVKKGTTVTWTNQDAVEHTVTEDDGQNGPSASPLNQGQSYSFTFNQTGTFHYHCTIHSEMTGTVTVTAS